jgi:hypothetical protein
MTFDDNTDAAWATRVAALEADTGAARKAASGNHALAEKRREVLLTVLPYLEMIAGDPIYKAGKLTETLRKVRDAIGGDACS